MKNRNIYEQRDVRKALVSSIYRHIDKDRMASALEEKAKYSRNDAIMNVLRDAVKLSPIIMFNGLPYTFSGRKYERITWNDLGDALYDVMRRCHVKDGDYGRIDAICKVCIRSVSDRDYSQDNSVIVLENGVFETADGRLHPFNENYLTTSSVDYSYDVNARCELWHRFLDDVLPDPEMQLLLQEFAGAALGVDRRAVKLEQMLILKGCGSNGKSVVFETFMNLVGGDNVSTFSIADLINKSSRQMNIASVNGKRLNYCSEIRTTEIGQSNADAFKALVSGEPTMARQIYGENFLATNIPLIMANANTLPHLSDSTYGLQRRMLIIPFDKIVVADEQNKELPNQLKAEMPGIFNWAMEGFRRLRSNDWQFTIPLAVERIVESYVNDFNSTLRWVEDRRIFARWNPNVKPRPEMVTVSECYRDYTEWSSKNTEYSFRTKSQFVSDLEGLGFPKKRISAGVVFTMYRVLSLEEIVFENMEIALQKEKESGDRNIVTKTYKDGATRVLGVDNASRYLGIPDNSIWKYFENGSLEGSYISMPDGPAFDIHELQKKLAAAGYYREMSEVPDAQKKTSLMALTRMRKKFNAYMEMRGLPFRMMGNKVKSLEEGLVAVPDGWVYSEVNANEYLEILKIKNSNYE